MESSKNLEADQSANKAADDAASAANTLKDEKTRLANIAADKIARAANQTHDENMRRLDRPVDR